MTRIKIYLSKKEREEKLLQGIQSADGLKACVDVKKANGTAMIDETGKLDQKDV